MALILKNVCPDCHAAVPASSSSSHEAFEKITHDSPASWAVAKLHFNHFLFVRELPHHIFFANISDIFVHIKPYA